MVWPMVGGPTGGFVFLHERSVSPSHPSPAENSGMRTYRVGLDQEPAALSASSHSSPSPPLSSSSCGISRPPINYLLATSLSKCTPPATSIPTSPPWCTLPLVQITSHSSFRLHLYVTSSRKPSLASLPDPILPYDQLWSSCLRCTCPMSVRFSDDCSATRLYVP